MSDQKNSHHYIAEGTVLEGNLVVDKTVVIDGTINGSVQSQQEVIFEKKGTMEGPVRAQIIKVKGKIKGDLFSNKKVEILPGGELEGNITTPPGGIVVHEGGILNSRLSTFQSGPEGKDRLPRKTK